MIGAEILRREVWIPKILVTLESIPPFEGEGKSGQRTCLSWAGHQIFFTIQKLGKDYEKSSISILAPYPPVASVELRIFKARLGSQKSHPEPENPHGNGEAHTPL